MAKPSLNNNAMYAYRYFQDKYKLAPHQAAGVVGNLMQESTFNTGAHNAGDGRDGSDSIGIGQWNGDRAKNFRAFAGENTGNLDTQLDFVMHEMSGKEGPGAGSERYAYNKLMGAQNVHDATAAMISYERPSGWSQKNPTAGHGFDNRLSWAGEVLGMKPEEIAGALPTSASLQMQAQGQTNVAAANTSTNPNAGKPYEDGLISWAQNKFSPDTAPKQPTVLPVGADGKPVERGLLEQITGKKMPTSLLGVKTDKGVEMLAGLTQAMGTDKINEQMQASAARGGRNEAAPVTLLPNPAVVQAEQDKKLKPWELLLAMAGQSGMGRM